MRPVLGGFHDDSKKVSKTNTISEFKLEKNVKTA